jgi:very-short-patch-repair endonuclease
MSRDPKRTRRAQALRKQNVPAEALLWKAIRNRALGGFRFRRQHPVGPFVVDFACVKCGLIVELDGETHLPRQAADAERTRFLEAEGWCVLRFWNTEIYEDFGAVEEAIYRACVTQADPG